MHIPKPWQSAISDGRLLVVSPFSEKHRRITAELAAKRNQLVSLLAHKFIVYAAPQSKTKVVVHTLQQTGKVVQDIREF